MDFNTIKLFCIPFSGGNAYSYAAFKKYLPEPVQLHNLELPGRGTRIAEPLLNSIDAMTEDLYKQIENKTDGNYVLFGHSLGALLCLTLCRYLSQKGAKLPLMLFVSGQTAPSLIEPDDRYCLPDDQFINMLREMEGTPEELLVDKSFIQYFLPIAKADFQSIANYKYVAAKIPMKIPFVVLLGSQENISDEDASRWQLETEKQVSIHRFEGGHFFIFNQTEEVCMLIEKNINNLI